MTLDAAKAEFTGTAQQNVLNLQASQAWSTPTAAALRAQATAQALESDRRQAQADNMAEFWRTIRTVIVALLIVAGLSAICVAVVDAITRIRVARLA